MSYESAAGFDVVVGAEGAPGKAAKQVLIEAAILAPGTTDTEFADWLAAPQAVVTPATTAAALANEKAALAVQKAALADGKATLANEKAALADQAATLANQKALAAQAVVDAGATILGAVPTVTAARDQAVAAAASLSGSVATIADLNNRRVRNATLSVTGTDDYVGTCDVPIAAYAVGLRVLVTWNLRNTGAARINLDGKGLRAVRRPDGTDLGDAELPLGETDELEMYHDGTNYAWKVITWSPPARVWVFDTFTSTSRNFVVTAAQQPPSYYEGMRALLIPNADNDAGDGRVRVSAGWGDRSVFLPNGDYLPKGYVQRGQPVWLTLRYVGPTLYWFTDKAAETGAPAGMREGEMPANIKAEWKTPKWTPRLFGNPATRRVVADKTQAQAFDLYSTARSAPALRLYVDPDTGNDAADGSIGAPLKTLAQAGINFTAAAAASCEFIVPAGKLLGFEDGDFNRGGVNYTPAKDFRILASGAGEAHVGPFLKTLATTVDGANARVWSAARQDIARCVDLTIPGPYVAAFPDAPPFYELPKLATAADVRGLLGVYDPTKGVFGIRDSVNLGLSDPAIPVGGAFYVYEGSLASRYPQLWVKGATAGVTFKAGGYAFEAGAIVMRRPDGQQVTAANTRLLVSQARNIYSTTRQSIWLGRLTTEASLTLWGGLGGNVNCSYGAGPGIGVDEKCLVADGVAFWYAGGAPDGAGAANLGNALTFNGWNGLRYLMDCRAGASANDVYNSHQTPTGCWAGWVLLNSFGFDAGRNGAGSANICTSHEGDDTFIIGGGEFAFSHGGTLGFNTTAIFWLFMAKAHDDIGDSSGQAVVKLGGYAEGYSDASEITPAAGQQRYRLTDSATMLVRNEPLDRLRAANLNEAGAGWAVAS